MHALFPTDWNLCCAVLLQTFSIADLDLEFGVTKPDPLTMDRALLVGSGQLSNKTNQAGMLKRPKTANGQNILLF